jgi:phosphopantetheinyl transferase
MAAPSMPSGGNRTLLVTVVADGFVGADVEEEPFGVFDCEALVRRMCSGVEQSHLDRLPRGTRRCVLARAWTIKEATLKPRGTGRDIHARRPRDRTS